MSRALVVVAHPDDETVFFGGLIADHPEVEWEVVCVTDGGTRAGERACELDEAARRLGLRRVHRLGFADVFDRRLEVGRLEASLRELGEFDEVYTHGPLGDYGHPHHQDVCLAVHRVFDGRVWSVATSVLPERLHRLSSSAYRLKVSLMSQVYAQELSRFLLILPPAPMEGFVRLQLCEVEALHAYLSRRAPCDPACLAVHGHLLGVLQTGAVERSARGFFAAYCEA